jgi:ribosomal protein S18 acetylase RimI-like enzyme
VSRDPPAIAPAHDDATRIAAWLEDRLYEFNVAATGFADGELFCFTIRDADRIVAGVAGHTWGGACEVKQLWVDEAWRGRGFGEALLARAEAEARHRACGLVVLSTHSFQAPAFYRARGYEEVGRAVDYPRGFASIYFVKRLDRGV